MTLNFGNLLSKIIAVLFIILREFWWIIIPLALFIYFLKIFTKYQTQVKKLDDDPLIFLELKFSIDSFKQPVTSMKNFFENLKNVKLKDGRRIVFELFCFNNQLRYIVITPKSLKDLIEVAFYSQYPDIKIIESLDYLSTLPPNIPNNSFDVWGEEYKLKKENIYQINVIKSDIVSEKDSKIIDPVTILLESTAKADFQGMVIIQIVLSQLTDDQKKEYKFESESIINKLLGKPMPADFSFPRDLIGAVSQMLHEMLFFNYEFPTDGKAEKKEASAEDKTKSSDLKTKDNFGTFACNFRVAYVSPKTTTEKFVPPSIGMFVKQFASSNNSFDAIASQGVEFKAEDVFSKWLAFLSKDSIELNMKKDFFKRLINRKLIKKIIVLNSEELASMYHFPFQKVSVKSLDYIKNKENAPPSNLPIVEE